MTFFVIPPKFLIFHPCFRPPHLQIYNYNCTIHLLQLQITFYNCRNCDQLRVKICPGLRLHTYAIICHDLQTASSKQKHS